MNIAEMTRQITAMFAQIEKDLAAQLAEVPENPEITRLSKNCFTVKSSTIVTSAGKNLSPQFYDWPHTARLIKEHLLPVKDVAVLKKKIEAMLKHSWFMERGQTSHTHIPPELMKILRPELEAMIKEDI